MATPVPYTGTPDVSPQFEPLQRVNVDTPRAAFGGAVADAVSHVGEVAEGAGKELFARGIAFQEMDEQVKADQASADTMDAQTKRYMEFDKLKGQERIDGFPQYIKDLEQIRMQGAQNLSSPYAKQKYLDDSRRQQSQMIWHGGMLARQGQDEATAASADAKVNAAIQRYGVLSPDDAHSFDIAAGEIKLAEEGKNHLRGGPEVGTPEAAEAAAKNTSAGVSQLILQKINGTNPAVAVPLIDHALKAGLLQPDAADVLKQKAENAVNFKLARKLGYDSADGEPGANPAEGRAKARAAAEAADPGNKVLATNTEMFHDQRRALIDNSATAADRYTQHVLISGIDGSTTNGKVPLTFEEAAEDPKWKAAFDSLKDDTAKQAVIEQIKRNNTTDGWIPNTAGNAEFARLHSVLVDPRSSAADVDTAMNTNLLDTAMTIEQRRQIGALQIGIVKAQSNEGNINNALRYAPVQQAIADAQLTKGTQPYADFVSAFTKTVDEFAQGKHGRLKDEDYKNIAVQMLQHGAGSWNPLHWNAGGQPAYQDPFSAIPGLKAKALQEFVQFKGRQPSPDELNAMSGIMYNKYFEELGQKSRPGVGKRPNRAAPSTRQPDTNQ